MRTASRTTALGLAAIVALGGVFYLMTRFTSNVIQLPKNVFDTDVIIPGTAVALSYPEQGFYGLGVEINTYTNEGDTESPSGVLLNPTASYDSEKGSEFITIDASGFRRGTQDETLKAHVDALLSSLDQQSYEYQYMKSSGEYKTINGHEFFISKATESVWISRAITMTDGQVIGVSMAYKPTDGLESKVALEHNDELFLQILAHLKF